MKKPNSIIHRIFGPYWWEISEKERITKKIIEYSFLAFVFGSILLSITIMYALAVLRLIHQ